MLGSWVNGQPGQAVTVTDRGLCYGDGLFETLAVLQGKPRRWDAHMERLQRGVERLQLQGLDTALLSSETRRLCANVERAVLKIIITRGSGGRGYRGPDHVELTRVLQLHPWPDYPLEWQRQGVRLRICHMRLALQPALAGIKHLNRLEQVLARQEWNDPQTAEGLMLDTEDRVISGTMSNLFFVREGALYTPDLRLCGIAGVTRAAVLEAAQRGGVATHVGDFQLSDLENAQEIFLCNSVIGIWPVAALAGRSFVPGTFTQWIADALDA